MFFLFRGVVFWRLIVGFFFDFDLCIYVGFEEVGIFLGEMLDFVNMYDVNWLRCVGCWCDDIW